MKTKEFKLFLDRVQTCSDDDPIWYCGYLLLDLTPRQVNRAWFVLAERFGIKDNGYGKATVYLPSGIGLVMPVRRAD